MTPFSVKKGTINLSDDPFKGQSPIPGTQLVLNECFLLLLASWSTFLALLSICISVFHFQKFFKKVGNCMCLNPFFRQLRVETWAETKNKERAECAHPEFLFHIPHFEKSEETTFIKNPGALHWTQNFLLCSHPQLETSQWTRKRRHSRNVSFMNKLPRTEYIKGKSTDGKRHKEQQRNPLC